MAGRNDRFNDIDFDDWKAPEYADLITDSLWLLGARDRSGPHANDYWGNFVPQIPNQIIRRFTRADEVVLELFSGMGTTLIECRRLGRHGIGIELNEEVATRSEERIALANGPGATTATVIRGDATASKTVAAVRGVLETLGRDQADTLIMHPPYHDIIRFSDDPRDLSTAPDLPSFLNRLGRAVANGYALLRPGGFAALVIGDKYADSTLVPLGFEAMGVCQRAGFQLKAINVKDIHGNEKGKGKSSNLWRYRALKQGYYIFKHEYVMVFRKPL